MLFDHRKLVALGERVWGFVQRHCSFFRYMYRRVLCISAEPHRVALGFSMGVFSAFSPFLGLHIILAVFFSWVFRGNFTAAVIGTIFSNPLTFFFIIAADYKVGHLLLWSFDSGDAISFSQISMMFNNLTFSQAWLFFLRTWDLILVPMIVGGTFLGFIFGSLSYVGIYRVVTRFQKRGTRR
ncbi:DUF2062 domain-containing protein [Bartonella ancashensis]|uniref:DUF2062 domain-containing protein n=1 Tax=Bartonella ancashensis TaxID=1318743 RepID=A0A0M4LKI8_9HYPH|nr:DUF2062 domain-containing protein [Bartonella ancashensis]ALE04002.1 hypothetical protein PU02_1188 [Bartonella ancashensis]